MQSQATENNTPADPVADVAANKPPFVQPKLTFVQPKLVRQRTVAETTQRAPSGFISANLSG